MKYKKESDLINDIIALASFGSRPREKDPYKLFGAGKHSVLFEGFETVEVYQEKIEALYQANNDINSSYTFKKFEIEIINIVREKNFEGRVSSSKDFEELVEKLFKTEIVEYEVFNELFGGELSIPKIDFGDFTLYNIELSMDELYKKYSQLEKHKELYSGSIRSNLLIGIKIKARESAKASEIADSYLRVFENIMNYVIADLSHLRSVGVFNFRSHKIRAAIVCSQKGFSSQTNTLHRSTEMNLEDSYLKNPEIGHDVIWSLITKKTPSAIEKRILNSAEWIGKAIYEKDFGKSLFQFVVAIEGMLQFNEKTLITPSIVSQLSDWLAFIIEDELEKRKGISKYFKQLYEKRSAIAHGGLKIIDQEDLDLALEISKRMIIAFLTKEPFKRFSRMEELNAYISELKFK